MDPVIIGLLVVLAINLLIYPIAYKLQTDKLTDITYALSFATIAVYAFLVGNSAASLPKLLIFLLVMLWAIRLGAFLLHRVTKMGRDARFDEIRTNPSRFLRFFLIQAVSSWVISLPFLFRLIDNPSEQYTLANITSVEWMGLGIAALGLIIEAIADQQKSNYKNGPNASNGVYTGGLYGIIRYPNYLGEILFWIGIFMASLSAIYGLRWLAITSPLIIIALLLFLSGIPTVEHARNKKYKDDPDYQKYVQQTKMLIPGIY